MSKPIPNVQRYMTTTPRTIEPSMTLRQASTIMHEGKFRHLPVLAGDQLVGLVSLSDLRLVEGLTQVNPAQVKVEDVMIRKPYTCEPDASVDAVADEMIGRKWGSAVVVQNGKVVGIFTSTDAMRALVDLSRTRLQK